MEPRTWAFTTMQDAPAHLQETVIAVLNTASHVDAVQKQLLDDTARVVEELSKILTGEDNLDHRSTAAFLGGRGASIDHLTIRRGELLRQLDVHLSVYQAAVTKPEPPATQPQGLDRTHPVVSASRVRGPRL
jgi:hypothetical protein